MKKKLIKLYTRIIFIIIGAALTSVGLEIFLIPNSIIDGGVVGISIMASHLTKLPLGLFTFVINIPFFIIGYKQIGKTFTLSTLFAVVCLSIGVTFLHPIPGLTQDTLLATVFGGITVGAGVGLIIRNGGSLDGTEIVAIILDKRLSFSIGEIVMFFNFFILSSAGFVFGWDRAMYSLIAYFIAFKVIDIIVEGVDESKGVIIISAEHKEIADAIMARLGRGVTKLDGKGGYKGIKTDVLYVVISRLEVAKIKEIVHGFDENALVTIGSVEVSGKKYIKKAIH
ncbi:YitT family protein [Clostridium cellulovorans]|uniref:DUF2179 domain-containing protein n=1 Tax=Clostridium cellulovorans (strain ATCC 35296 / DSM 3052 / OCM 3 / 743B) TaxID=573061 RepID=D9SRF9_CLOC7|nr:YitT family protein [Clostridium cellulovorans]ADL52388.1 Protein of unknown function DUF2179 [Clostridium cellulovorans 743B]